MELVQYLLKKANKVIDELLKLSTLLVEAPSQAPDSAVRTSNAFKEVEEKRNLNILFFRIQNRPWLV